jgi:hypothetical protein
MALTDTQDRAKRAAAGRGAWRELAAGHDLVAELIAERRAAAAAEDRPNADKPPGRLT